MPLRLENMKLKLTTVYSLQAFQLMRYASMILIGVFMAKSSLGMGAIGEYEQFMFVAGGVSFFWLNGLIRGLLPIYKEDDRGDARFFNAFVLVSALSALSGAVIFMLSGAWFPAPERAGDLSVRWILAAFLFFSVPASLTEYYFLLKKKSLRILFYGAFSFVLMIVLVLLPVWLGWGIDACLLGALAWAVVRYVVLWVLLLRYVTLEFSMAYQREHVGVSVPLVLSALVSGAGQYVDGAIVRSHFDESVFAVFRYGAREFPLVLLMANAFSNAMLPVFQAAENADEALQKIKRESSRLSVLLFPLSAILLVTSHWFFPVFFNPNFTAGATVFNIYLLLITSRLLFPQTILIGMKQTGVIAWASVWELLLNVAFSLLFVQFWGINGVAFATVLAYLFEKVYLVVMTERRLNIAVTKYQNITRHVIYSLLLCGLYILVEYVIY